MTNEKREFLKELSEELREEVKRGTYKSLNDALIQHYKAESGAETFKSFSGWYAEGKRVKKGAKGFPIWGRPFERIDSKKGEKYKFYPVSYLFNEKQVNTLAPREAGEPPQEAEASRQTEQQAPTAPEPPKQDKPQPAVLPV